MGASRQDVYNKIASSIGTEYEADRIPDFIRKKLKGEYLVIATTYWADVIVLYPDLTYYEAEKPNVGAPSGGLCGPYKVNNGDDLKKLLKKFKSYKIMREPEEVINSISETSKNAIDCSGDTKEIEFNSYSTFRDFKRHLVENYMTDEHVRMDLIRDLKNKFESECTPYEILVFQADHKQECNKNIDWIIILSNMNYIEAYYHDKGIREAHKLNNEAELNDLMGRCIKRVKSESQTESSDDVIDTNNGFDILRGSRGYYGGVTKWNSMDYWNSLDPEEKEKESHDPESPWYHWRG